MDDIEISLIVTGAADMRVQSDACAMYLSNIIHEVLRGDTQLDVTSVSPWTGEPIHIPTQEASALQWVDSITISSPRILAALMELDELYMEEPIVRYIDDEEA